MSVLDKGKLSVKHLLVDKNNNVILYAAAATVAIIIFVLFASVALGKQIAYQSKVIGLRNQAANQLQINSTSADSIVSAYQQFEGAKESIIGTKDKNPKIILDALPSKYDFPALTASLEALAGISGVSLESITGIDEEAVAQQDSVDPKPIAIPFQISASGSLDHVKLLVQNMEFSIRPIQILSMTISASGTNSGGQDVVASISAQTYYQPEKLLNIEQYAVGQDGKIINNTGGGTQ